MAAVMNPPMLSTVKQKLIAKAVDAGILGYVLRDSATNKRLIYCKATDLCALIPTAYKVKGTGLVVSLDQYGLQDLIALDDYAALLLAEQQDLKTIQITDPDLSAYNKTRDQIAVYRDDDVYTALTKFGTVPLVTLSERDVELLDLSAVFNGAMSKACVFMCDSQFKDGMIVKGRPLIPLVANAALIKDLIIDAMRVTASQQHSPDIVAAGVDDESERDASRDSIENDAIDDDEAMTVNAFKDDDAMSDDEAGDTEAVKQASETLDCLGVPFAVDRAGDRAYITAFLQEHKAAKYDASSDTFDRNGLVRIMTGVAPNNLSREVERVRKFQAENV